MAPRRINRPRKNGRAVGSFIRRQLAPLERLAQLLNAPAGEIDAASGLDDEAAWQHAVASARSVIESVSRLRPTQDPPDAVWREWEALSIRNPFVFWSTTTGLMAGGPPRPELADPSTWFVWVSTGALRERGRKWAGGAWLRLRTPYRSGMVVALLAEYLNSLYRDRLKQCPQCRRWFVDLTRNKSALRCSRACTITWSNAQRKEPRR